MPFTESTPLHKQVCMLFFKESLKHVVIEMTEILNAMFKRTQMNNLTISIKFPILLSRVLQELKHGLELQLAPF